MVFRVRIGQRGGFHGDPLRRATRDVLRGTAHTAAVSVAALRGRWRGRHTAIAPRATLVGRGCRRGGRLNAVGRRGCTGRNG